MVKVNAKDQSRGQHDEGKKPNATGKPQWRIEKPGCAGGVLLLPFALLFPQGLLICSCVEVVESESSF
jgi:hypothetical protein